MKINNVVAEKIEDVKTYWRVAVEGGDPQLPGILVDDATEGEARNIAAAINKMLQLRK